MRGRSLPAVDNVNADRDQDHCDDILDFEFLVKQKSGEDDAQDRDQGISAVSSRSAPPICML